MDLDKLLKKIKEVAEGFAYTNLVQEDLDLNDDDFNKFVDVCKSIYNHGSDNYDEVKESIINLSDFLVKGQVEKPKFQKVVIYPENDLKLTFHFGLIYGSISKLKREIEDKLKSMMQLHKRIFELEREKIKYALSIEFTAEQLECMESPMRFTTKSDTHTLIAQVIPNRIDDINLRDIKEGIDNLSEKYKEHLNKIPDMYNEEIIGEFLEKGIVPCVYFKCALQPIEFNGRTVYRCPNHNQYFNEPFENKNKEDEK